MKYQLALAFVKGMESVGKIYVVICKERNAMALAMRKSLQDRQGLSDEVTIEKIKDCADIFETNKLNFGDLIDVKEITEWSI